MKKLQFAIGCVGFVLVVMLISSCILLALAVGYQREVNNTLVAMSTEQAPQDEDYPDPVVVPPSPTAVPSKTPAMAKPADAGKVGILVPSATPTRPLSETDPLVKLELAGSGVKVAAEIIAVQSYCFLPNGAKYVAKGEQKAHAGERCPDGIKGEFRWDIPSSTKGIYRVGWQTGYPNESPTVLNGHKDGPGGNVFQNLQLLTVGDRLVVTTKSGKVFQYVMYDWKLFPLESESLFWAINGIQTKDLPSSILITYTCGGDLQNGQYLQRRVIYWKPVSSK